MTAPFATILVSVVAAVLILAQAHGFGRGDLGWFLFWTLPLAMATWLMGKAMRALRSRTLLFNIVAIGTGLLAGFAWSVVVAVLHGVFIGAASIPFNFICRSPRRPASLPLACLSRGVASWRVRSLCRSR